MMAPTVEELAADFAGKAKVGKLNVDLSPEIAERYGIMSIPTLLIFRGGEVFYKAIGVQSKQVGGGRLEQGSEVISLAGSLHRPAPNMCRRLRTPSASGGRESPQESPEKQAEK